MNNPKVSIAMTTYNGEAFLEEQLNSLLIQSFSDFELIICDDGSKDNTINILNEYSNNDKRIKIIKNKENKGYAKNFLYATSLCSGEFIFLADQDDIWKKDKIQKMLQCIQNNKKINLLVCKDIDFKNGEKLPKLRKQNNFHSHRISSKKSLINCAYRGLNFCLRKTFVDNVIFSYDLGKWFPAHDWLFQIFATETKSIYKLNQILTFHRKHQNNTASINEDKTNRYTKRLSVLKNLIAHYDWAFDVVKNKKMHSELKKIKFYNFLRLKLSLSKTTITCFLYFVLAFLYSIFFNLPKKRLCGDFIVTTSEIRREKNENRHRH